MSFHLKSNGSRATQRPALDDDAAGWIRVHRRPFDDYSVGSLVPVVFERYARVLHPAWAGPNQRVRWDAVAAWSGRTIHALAQWEFLSRPLGEVAPGCPFDRPPEDGRLPPQELAILCDVLAAYTSTPDLCSIGVWEGYGWLEMADPSPGPELRLDQRTFLVRQGPIENARLVGWRSWDGTFISEPPTLIWPSDRAWFLAGDVDLDSTYIGGSAALVTAILAQPGLEAWPADATDRVSIDSDSMNGP